MTEKIKLATKKQKDVLGDLVRDAAKRAVAHGEITSEEAQEIIRRGGDFKRHLELHLTATLRRFATPLNIIHVPDLPATELTELCRRERDLTCVESDQAKWDFYTDRHGNSVSGRDKRFEAVVWKPDLKSDETISSKAVREHFRREGLVGHAGAFTQWLRTTPDPTGYYATIPEDDQCWCHPESGSLGALYSVFVGGKRELRLLWVGLGWNTYWSFVGFREVSS